MSMDTARSLLRGDHVTIPACNILDLFESHAQSMVTRDTAAVIDDTSNASLTYGELNRDSTVVAKKLLTFVQSTEFPFPESTTSPEHDQPVIAVYIGPSLERIVVLLGIWKINGVLLPLDVSMPTSRMRLVLHQARASVVISADVEPRFDELKNICGELGILYLDYYTYLNRDKGTHVNNIIPQHLGKFANGLSDPLLTIFFTSGSTGEPKGIHMRTGNWLNLVTSYWNEFPFRQDDIGCHKTSIGFVESLNEILVCVLGGIPLVVLGRESASNPETLLQKLEQYRVTHVSLVPSMARAITKIHQASVLRCLLQSVRVFVCNSETLEPPLARELRASLPDACALVNMYGSTETTCAVTKDIFRNMMDIDERTSNGVLSIGSPILNTTVYILDGKRRLLEQGSQGYIYIAGSNVTDGYIGDNIPDTFMRNPFELNQTPKKIFNTGDIGFMRDSRLYFMGRHDNMVKIRGQRVSCSEIEHVVYETSYVEKVVVAPIHDADSVDANKLVAFCTRKHHKRGEHRAGFMADDRGGYFSSSVDSDPGLRDDARDLDDVTVASSIEAHCRLGLPSYMVPSVILLHEFPLKPLSGKIDRVALTKNYLESQTVQQYSEDHGSGRDEDILRIIANELQMSRPLLQKNMAYKFMELGGNSLSAVNVVLLLRAKNYQIDVDRLISAPISDLLRIKHATETPSRPGSVLACAHTADAEQERIMRSRFVIKLLNEVQDHETIKRLMALAFTQKNPLDVLMGTSLREFMIFINSIWLPFVEDNMSFVVVDRHNRNTIVAASLNVDLETRLDPEVQMEEVTAINEAVENPVKLRLGRDGGRWMDAMLNAVDVSLPNNLSLPLLMMMEEFVIELAQELRLDGIVTVNSHQVTMALAEQKFGYVVENVLHVKTFQYGGRRPFCGADDDYFIKCMTRRLR